MDIVPPETRSRIMAAVPQKHSQPELIVRRLVHGLGYRYRLHRKDLPGSPDLVFSRIRKVIFVHGCFWHRHGCKKTTTPASNLRFWNRKFEANVKRDRRVIRDLTELGWNSFVIWSCQTRRTEWLTRRLERFLHDG